MKEKIITFRINDVEEKMIKEIQEHMEKIIGKGIRLTQSDVIRQCINDFYYQNIT